MVQLWISYEEPSILCMGLMGRPFSQDYVFLKNLACVPFSHDRFLAWDSFRQPWFVHDNGFSPISLMVHSTKSSQAMYGSDLGSKVGLLRACIRFDLSYINEYEFGLHGVQSWLGIIKILGFFSNNDQQIIILKLKGNFVNYCPYYLEESFLAMQETIGFVRSES